jgi:protein-S-isoprenylcysteine O-methyltransferase Ste14
MAGAAELHGLRPATPVAPWAVRAAAIPPALIALMLGAAAVAAHLALWGEAQRFGPSALAGALIAGAGLAVVLWSAVLFRIAGNPLRSRQLPLQLIEEGPYRYSRHPMYLGLAAMLVGAAVALGMPLLVLSAVAFGAIVGRVHVPHEEARLAGRFGGWWRDYAGSTRRWL